MSNYFRKVNVIDYSLIPENFTSIFPNEANDEISRLVFDVDFDEIEVQKILLANDEVLVFDIEKKSRLLFSLLTVPFFIILFVFGYLWYTDEPHTPKLLFSIISLGLIIAIIAIGIYVIFAPKKELIFDRKHGLVTFPNSYISENITMPYENVRWSFYLKRGVHSPRVKDTDVILKNPKSKFYNYSFIPFFRRPNDKDAYTISWYPEETISFFNWYMDSNRPLPPCKMFEVFRDKDYLRRKKSGFKKARTKLIDRTQGSDLDISINESDF